jgi:hypothetical protein
MPFKFLAAIIGCCVVFSGNVRGQGYVALDNTSQPITGTNILQGSVGTQIQTGANAAGYTLNNLQLLFANANGNPNPSWFSVVLFADSSGAPGGEGSLLSTEINPLTDGLYTFIPTSDAFLTANTDYWIIINVTAGSSSDYYNWLSASSTAAISSDGWSITGNTAIGQNGFPIFLIGATPVAPVPEPTTFALLIPAMLAVVLRKKSLG